MPQIKVLPKNIAELIAAGEVVERPASVIKELVENAIDAGATTITVEIQHGGVTYMRVADNGCGIARDQIRTAFLRHATSKVASAEDLNSILTLGFRGEALASVCAVAKVEMITAAAGAELGACYTIHGGEELSLEDAGCPQGTTVIVRDLFYNVPARMKFLKKDVTEGSAVGAIMDRLALSHPEIGFHFIKDGKQVLATAGDGKQRSAIYAVLGRDFSKAMIELPAVEGPVTVTGFTCRPTNCRPNRNGQFFFINGRFIKSGTVSAALDQAYKNSAMVGKFPACVLNIRIDPNFVDVNVHPTKTEVRFTNERLVFEAVYRTVKTALAAGDERPEIRLPQKKQLFAEPNSGQFRQAEVDLSTLPEKQKEDERDSIITLWDDSKISASSLTPGSYRLFEVQPHRPNGAKVNLDIAVDQSAAESAPNAANGPAGQLAPGAPAANASLTPVAAPNAATNSAGQSAPTNSAGQGLPGAPANLAGQGLPLQNANGGAGAEPSLAAAPAKAAPQTNEPNFNHLRYVGQAFDTYILVSLENTLYFIDKHAAHERMNFEKLKAARQVNPQLLLEPVAVNLLPQEHAAVLERQGELKSYGVEVEDFGNGAVLVRAVPSELSGVDVPTLMSEIAGNILEKSTCESDRTNAILHSIACKAAIKAGDYTSVTEQLELAKAVLSRNDLMYCPHGRPIAFKLTRQELEKQFGRLV